VTNYVVYAISLSALKYFNFCEKKTCVFLFFYETFLEQLLSNRARVDIFMEHIILFLPLIDFNQSACLGFIFFQSKPTVP